MKYIIIKSGNFSDIEKVQADAKVRKDASYKIDAFDNYAHGTFAIIGADAVSMFCEKYGFSFSGNDTIKTDGKTKAEIIPYITPSYYYDARDGGRGGITDIYTHSKIGCLVKYNGVILEHYKKHYNSDARGFYLFNDETDYNKYLPNNWENENPRPNYVGVITDKKISDWVNWLNARKNAAESAKMAANNKVSAFMEKIRAFDVSGCTEYQINEKHGYFVRNGLRYSYEIGESGYISESIKIDYDVNLSKLETLEKFKLMTVGNFCK